MSIGHGQLGFRSGLDIFDNLQTLSFCRKDAVVEIDGAQEVDGPIVGGWSASGSMYTRAWAKEFDNEPLPVVGVRVSGGEVLRWVNAPADVNATAGTFHYVPNGFGTALLYVHLTGGANPNSYKLIVTTTFRVGTAGRTAHDHIQPVLGAEMFADGGYEASTLPSWTEVLSGAGWATSRDSTELVEGDWSLLLSSSGAASGNAARYQVPASSGTFGLGEEFRVCGYYSTPADFPSNAHAYVRVGTTNTLLNDGRTSDTSLSAGCELLPTFGKVRFFTFDFRNHEADCRIWFRLTCPTATACSVRFDKVSCRKIVAWRFTEPRLALDGLPETTQGSSTVLPGSQEVGGGTVKLVNGDGRLWRQFSPEWYYPTREIRGFIGGAFPSEQEILFNDMPQGYTGRIAGDRFLEIDDHFALVQTEDVHTILSAGLPRRTYDAAGYPNVEERDKGRPRPLVFGACPHTRAAGISLNSSSYRVYEACDTTDWPTGISAITNVYAFPDEESADKNVTAVRVTLTAGSGKDYTTSLTGGTFEVIHDVQVILITRENNKLDISFGTIPTTIAVTITPGYYVIGDGDASVAGNRRGLLEALRQACNTASGTTNFGFTYSNSTHKVTCDYTGKGGATFLWNTGANRAQSMGATLGFDSGTNTASPAVGTDSIFTSADDQHILRADIVGFIDDGSGTYTGTPGAIIHLGPDMFRFAHGVLLAEPSSYIDTASFVQARTDCPQVLAAYLGNLARISGGGFDMTLQDFVDRLENSGSAEVQVDGAGIFYYKKRTTTIPSNAVRIVDRDYLSFKGFFAQENNVYGTVIVNYSQDASTGVTLTVAATNTSTTGLQGRPQVRNFDTFLTDQTDATNALGFLGALTRQSIRQFEFDLLGRVMKSKPGDIYLLTRGQALQGVSPDTTLDADDFRLMKITKNWMTHRCKAIVHTNVVA